MTEAINICLVVPTFLQNQGLSVFVPPDQGPGWNITGQNMGILTIPLAPGQQIQTEPGTMCFASNGTRCLVKFGGFGHILSGEAIFKSMWHNSTGIPGYISLTPNIPATIVPILLDQLGGSIKCKRDAFMAAINPNVKITIALLPTDSCLACCCSGMDMFMQQIVGSGWVFMQAHGTIMQKMLGPGEEIVVDTNSVVAVSGSVTVDVTVSGSCGAVCCAGEGLFNTTLKGPGLIILCSMPIEKLRKLFPPPMTNNASASKNNKNKIGVEIGGAFLN